MTKLLLNLGIVITLLCVSCEIAAQSDIALATRKAELQALSKNLQKRDENDRRQVQEFARRVGIPIRRELPNGRVLELQRIAPGIGPIFYITNNTDAADTVSTDEVRPGGSAGLNLDGSGMTVAEWDGGAVYEDHWDFIGRLTQVDGAMEVSNHSTHVAGTLIGSGAGLLAESRGMAYAAHLDAYDWNSDTAEMAAAASAGLLVSNHSYGIAAGWLYMAGPEPDTWWWIGGAEPSDVEDPYFGYYDSETQLWDQIAFNAPYYLIVKAAGNDRQDIGPIPGEEYTIIDQNGEFVSISTLPRNVDCAPAGYDCLPTNSVAKNVLTVGAVDDLIGGYSIFSGPSSVQMAGFSGWGPTDDGRIKPDLVGNGMFLLSAWGDEPYYAAAAGTSMSTPNVSGSLLLLQEHYENINGADNFMRAASLKALAIHTADEAGSANGPDYAFGWGLLNTKSAAQVISDEGGAHRIIEGNLLDSAVDAVEISVTNANAVLVATLVWTDPPGTPVPLALDAPDSMLVNDLDLRIKKGPATYLPWILNPAVPAAAATTGDNFRDNVEQVVASGGGTGSYFVEVSHKGASLNGGNQSYSLIISVRPPPPTGSNLLVDEDFSGGLPAGWSLNKVTGIDWTFQTPVPGGSRLDNLTGGSGMFAMVDANYRNAAVTSLQMPTFDLSSTAAVVLRFKSYFYFDESENINVDISTDGGAGWTNVWTFGGFNPTPTLHTLDLTGVASGQASVTLRFHYNNYGISMGNIWQVDDVELEVFVSGPPPGDPPDPATSPNPVDGATGLGYETSLSWSAGSLATSHDVYFGTDASPDAGEFLGSQGGTAFDPGTLAYSTTYYWRVDEVNADGTTTGNVWSFTTEAAVVLPSPAGNPDPADTATGVSIDANLGWTAGSDTDSHDVYFGTSPSPGAGESQGNQTGTTFEPGTLLNSTTYYWRIDEVNAAGTTPGGVWSFTTEGVPVMPGMASNLSPADSEGDVDIDVNLSWVAGTNTDSHDIYCGTNPSPGSGEFQGSQTGPTFNPGTLAGDTTYYWRIDEVNGDGTTTGPVWSFTTQVVAVPTFEITNIVVAMEPVKGPRNKGVATITVLDGDGIAVEGVALGGTLGGDWIGTRSGTTNSSGQLIVETPGVKNGNYWTFCVDTASKADWVFNETDSADWLCGAPPPPPTTGSIDGTVTDMADTSPIAGASVSTETGQSASTDVSGNYTLTNVPTGDRTVTISASGYDSTSKQTGVLDGATSPLNFALAPSATGGGTGTIKGTVKSTTGARLSGVTVQVIDGPSATTNKRGKYTIQSVPEGAQSVRAYKSGVIDTTKPVTISAGVTATLNFN